MRLAASRGKLETRIGQLRGTLECDHPLNDIVVGSYNAHMRWKTATERLLQGIKEFKLTVHDGRGRPLNQLVWSDPRFRYYCDLSIVVNSKTAGAPRWQPARIDKDKFSNWLATLTPVVPSPRESSPQEQLTEFLRQQVAAAKGGPHKNKSTLRNEAVAQIPGATGRMFDVVWSNIVPDDWRESGAPRKPRA